MAEEQKESTNPEAAISELHGHLQRLPVRVVNVAPAVDIDPKENHLPPELESQSLERERAARQAHAPSESSAGNTRPDGSKATAHEPLISALPPPD